MSNHWHCVVYADSALPTKAEVIRRFTEFHKGDVIIPDWNDPKVLKKFKAKMRDISWFTRDLQQRFTYWYNNSRKISSGKKAKRKYASVL